MTSPSRETLATFHQLIGELDYPMVVVTAGVEGERSGCLVGFHNQASIDPARWWIGISKKNHTYGVARRADVLAVHFLSADDVALARQFGERTGDEVDKFADVRWHDGPGGSAILDDCSNWVVFRVIDHHDGGDHFWFLGEPVAAEHGNDLRQLGFQAVKDLDPGHDA